MELIEGDQQFDFHDIFGVALFIRIHEDVWT